MFSEVPLVPVSEVFSTKAVTGLYEYVIAINVEWHWHDENVPSQPFLSFIKFLKKM